MTDANTLREYRDGYIAAARRQLAIIRAGGFQHGAYWVAVTGARAHGMRNLTWWQVQQAMKCARRIREMEPAR